MEARQADIGEMLLRILNGYHQNQRKPRYYGLDEPLYASEVHLVMLIGKHPAAGVTELAAAVNVTKGAISQMAQKLEHKGLIVKSTDPGNATRVIFSLTGKGRTVLHAHERIHEESDKELIEFLHGLKPEQLDTVQRFLGLVLKGIEERSKKSET